VLLAVDSDTQRIVGFINVISDGVLTAYIPLLEARPEYRGRGIGSELVRRMIARLQGFYMIDLVCDRELESFYARFGLGPASAMAYRNLAVRSGSPEATG
jgi:GNAT superfamily N-acetyltransferase